ncbi:tyrosine-type recombinase/integrase [uncultured Hymenobacter sp.]|uniref:tyrosine-type recombinase/integrase n=1 Tax=uncultured Hymenobacter sp. TaxID=170016 RepID=UPI0035CAE8F1
MKISRQLRLDQLNADGQAPIQLTITWEGNRVRVGTGATVLPAHWDAETQLLKTINGTAHSSINPRLNRATEAAGEAQETARKEFRRLPLVELRAAVLRSLALAEASPTPAAAEPTTAPESAGFLALMSEWIEQYRLRFNPRTHLPISETYIRALHSTRSRFVEFAQFWPRELSLANMDQGFYHDFYRYEREHLGQKLNTFGKHISRLGAFLEWCEQEKDLAVNIKYRKFQAPTEYVGVDALTEAELRGLQALDFCSADMATRLVELRGQQRAKGLLPQQASFQQWAATLELARDKFLLCCYTGLRISDAERLGWQHIKGQVIKIRAGKNQHDCYIPYYDDELFHLVALVARYDGRAPQGLLLPTCSHVNDALKLVQQLAGIRRLSLSTKLGRKTFVTLKLYQGVPARTVMQTTGHTTEKAFNQYVGVDTLELLKAFVTKSPGMRRHAA